MKASVLLLPLLQLRSLDKLLAQFVVLPCPDLCFSNFLQGCIYMANGGNSVTAPFLSGMIQLVFRIVQSLMSSLHFDWYIFPLGYGQTAESQKQYHRSQYPHTILQIES
jgi:hypothetical protein